MEGFTPEHWKTHTCSMFIAGNKARVDSCHRNADGSSSGYITLKGLYIITSKAKFSAICIMYSRQKLVLF